MLIKSLFLLFLSISNITKTNAVPTVLMHGVLASKANMDELKQMLEMNFKIHYFVSKMIMYSLKKLGK